MLAINEYGVWIVGASLYLESTKHADASVHLDNGAPVKLKWMWGDASIPYLTRALSYFNPLRWSGELSKAGLIHELQNQARSAPASQKRPVRVCRSV